MEFATVKVQISHVHNELDKMYLHLDAKVAATSAYGKEMEYRIGKLEGWKITMFAV